MRPGGKSNGVSPFFESPNLSFEGRDRNVAYRKWLQLHSKYYRSPDGPWGIITRTSRRVKFGIPARDDGTIELVLGRYD